MGPYIRWSTDEYKFFLLLPVFAASPDGEPPKQAKYLYNTQQQDIQYSSQQVNLKQF
jgi:hypothetical protein